MKTASNTSDMAQTQTQKNHTPLSIEDRMDPGTELGVVNGPYTDRPGNDVPRQGGDDTSVGQLHILDDVAPTTMGEQGEQLFQSIEDRKEPIGVGVVSGPHSDQAVGQYKPLGCPLL